MKSGQLRSLTCLSAATIAVVLAAGFGRADDPKQVNKEQVAAASDFFESRIRPLLANNCYQCHGASQQMGGLRLDSREAMLKGNAGGPVLKPGDSAGSRLIQAVQYDGRIKMPPTGKLTKAQIQTLVDWIGMGAPWPAVKPSDIAGSGAAGEYAPTEAQRKHWSFQPVRKPSLPAVKNRAWCANPNDYNDLARLEQNRMQPAPPADRRTLIRRAYFDLIGLPPTADEIDAFAKDTAPNAWEKVVDRLLAMPQYGERWGRHWLDVARYADTKGYVFVDDRTYHNAYTYRDYVIRAFNEDLPYDQFVTQQLAADRLPLGDDRRPLAAMGFLTLGRRFLNNQHDIIDDRIDVTMRGFEGLTVNCARCHDHKFDPIPTKDYYSLYGIFASSTEPDPPLAISPRAISEPYEAYNKKLFDTRKEYEATIRSQIELLRRRVKQTPDTLSAEIKQILQSIREHDLPDDRQLAKLEPEFRSDSKTALKSLRSEMENLKSHAPPAPEFACAMTDLSQPVTPHVLVRGNPANQGPEVPRQFVGIVAGPGRKPFTEGSGSGRLELAKAIASPTNPLTARVFVNRVWRWHFGAGLVRTPSDFGMRGDDPTHPELLDWLAAEFVTEDGRRKTDEGGNPSSVIRHPSDTFSCGWSIKKLQRLILLSSTYRQASDVSSRAFAVDPENRLISRFNRQRLDLEALRDSLLYVAGNLDEKIGGPSVDIVKAPFSTRRTVYGFIDRQNLEGLYRTFDFATPDASSPQRYTTTIPQQALFMMNSPFVVEQAEHLLQRQEVRRTSGDPSRIRALYRLVLGRSPTAAEIAVGVSYLHRPDTRTASLVSATADQKPGATVMTAWDRYAQALLMTNEFTFVD